LCDRQKICWKTVVVVGTCWDGRWNNHEWLVRSPALMRLACSIKSRKGCWMNRQESFHVVAQPNEVLDALPGIALWLSRIIFSTHPRSPRFPGDTISVPWWKIIPWSLE
jgi:hypothetical protein